MKQHIDTTQWESLKYWQKERLINWMKQHDYKSQYSIHFKFIPTDINKHITIGMMLDYISSRSSDWFIDKIDEKHGIEVDVDGFVVTGSDICDSLWGQICQLLGGV